MPTSETAVIYCRVSSPKQKMIGDGLRGQQRSCRLYARAKGYTVLRVFDDDITGSSVSRAGFDKMLAFLDERKAQAQETVVIIDDIKRFARDVINHYSLKVEIYRRGGRLESPLFQFEDTPEGKFRETIFAAQAELERTQNARQVRNRMKAKLEEGLWIFSHLPPGYRYVRHPAYKKVLALDTSCSELVREALRGYATNRFGSVAEVYRFLKGAGFFGVFRSRSVTRHLMCVHRMLRQLLFTGYLEYLPWGITQRKGRHPALITLSEFYAIQDKLAGRSNPIVRSDSAREFPLRNLIACADCGKPMTASWSRGRSGKGYAYYHCYSQGCLSRGRTVPKARLEAEFAELLQAHEATDAVVNYARDVATEQWEEKQAHRSDAAALIGNRIKELDQQIDRLSARAGTTVSDTMFKRLECEIERLVRERCRLEETEAQASEPEQDFRTAFEKVRVLLKSPYETWISGDLHRKRMVTRMVFPRPIVYSRKLGFRTAELSLPYSVLQRVKASSSTVVHRALKSSKHSALTPTDGQDAVDWEEFIEIIREWAMLVN